MRKRLALAKCHPIFVVRIKPFHPVMNSFNLITLPSFADARGGLSVIDRLLPFNIQRVYWIYDADGATRGGHRHRRNCQALVAVSGRVVVHMDDGRNMEDVVLDRPNLCLVVEPKDWHTMAFGRDAILLVLASESYDVTDYIDEPYPR